MSSFTGGFEHYAPWKTIDTPEVVTGQPSLKTLIRGVFEPARFLDILRNFVVFSDEPTTNPDTGQRHQTLIKRVANTTNTGP